MDSTTIDCVEMKREAQRRIYETIKGMSREEQIRFFNSVGDGDSPLARKFRQLRARSTSAPSGSKP